MTLFGRYLSRRFFGPFFFGLGIFSVIVFLIDVFDKINKLATTQASARLIVEYLALTIPYWTVRIVPMATLLATLFTVNGFVRSGEYVAVQASGFEPNRFFRPILFFAALISACAFAAQETVLPAAFARAGRIWQEAIHPQWQWDMVYDGVLTPGPNRFLSVSVFHVREGEITRAILDDYSESILRRQVDGAKAHWEPAAGRWVFESGSIKIFDERGVLSDTESFERFETDLSVPPRELLPSKMRPDEMSLMEAYRESNRLSGLGRSAREVRTVLHQKIAYPFTNIVLCLIGIPIALRLRRSPPPVAFAVALVVSFLYMWCIEFSWYLGKSGRVAPILAAWMPNGFFGVGALWLQRRLDG